MNFIVILHTLTLIGIFVFIGILLHYKQEYSFTKENKKITVILFLLIITALMILSTVALFQISWEGILQLKP